jgi:hypothetical protein
MLNGKNDYEYRFDCGCKFKALSQIAKECDGLPPLDIDLYNLPYCPSAWSDVGMGKVKGVFQVEKHLGKKWCSEIKPMNTEELSAIISIIRPGCISSDTKILTEIKFNKKGIRYFNRISISKMFENKEKYKNLISLNEKTGEFFENKILNIIYSGKKECFKLKISKYISHSKGHKEHIEKHNILECTDDHKIFTNTGWKEVKDLKFGDRIAFLKKKNKKNNVKELINSRHHSSIKIKNIKGIFNYQEICNQNYEYKCVMCDWKDSKLDVNHIDGNRHTNNSPENLCFFCPNHHRMFSEGKISKETIIQNREKYKLLNPKDIFWSFYLGKESVGIKDTYDISVEGPNHNFIAGNTVVHNCLESMIGNKSMTQHFADRKNGIEEAIPIHPLLENILNETQQIIIYQEQIIKISIAIAGFTGVEADTLRRGIGHKDPAIISSLEKKFVEGCVKTSNMDEKDAQQIFEIIRKSQRYLFNKSILDSTIVETKDGLKTIADLSIGEFIKAPKEDQSGDEFVEVTNKFDHGTLEVFELELENDKKITCTMEHKFLCSDNIVRPLFEIVEGNFEIVCED